MLFLSLISATQAVTVSGIEFTADYGVENVSAVGDKLTINMNTQGGGSRLKGGQAAMHGKFCAVPEGQFASGSVLAMYVSSQEPVDRGSDKWDELDFEFMLENGTVDNGKVWINAFHDGQDLKGFFQPTGLSKLRGSASNFCIAWSIGTAPNGKTINSAVWTVDDRVIFSRDLTGWTKPLMPYVSFWSSYGSGNDGLISWTGPFTPAAGTATLSKLSYTPIGPEGTSPLPSASPAPSASPLASPLPSNSAQASPSASPQSPWASPSATASAGYTDDGSKHVVSAANPLVVGAFSFAALVVLAL